MLKSYLEHKDLVLVEPVLERFLFSEQVDLSDKIASSFPMVVMDIKNRGIDLRYVGTPLTLEEDSTETDTVSTSGEDKANRDLLIVTVSAISSVSPTILQLQGSNDEDGTYTDVGSPVSLGEVGTYKMFLYGDIYTYYKLTRLVTGASVTYSAMLTESVFHYLHLYKAIEMIFQSLERIDGDNWYAKRIEYKDLYMDLLQNSIIYIDSDADGLITSEDNSDQRVVNISL